MPQIGPGLKRGSAVTVGPNKWKPSISISEFKIKKRVESSKRRGSDAPRGRGIQRKCWKVKSMLKMRIFAVQVLDEQRFTIIRQIREELVKG